MKQFRIFKAACAKCSSYHASGPCAAPTIAAAPDLGQAIRASRATDAARDRLVALLSVRSPIGPAPAPAVLSRSAGSAPPAPDLAAALAAARKRGN